MIIAGKAILKQKIITGVIDEKQQCQPCGIDLSLKSVYRWTSRACIDFDNAHRKKSKTQIIPFDENDHILLQKGAYLVEFNEKIDVPLDMVGQLFVRSSLFRNGCITIAGIIDSGYRGSLGALLQVVNPYGVELLRNAKLCQCVINQMNELVVGYSGIYQDTQKL